MPNTKPSQQPAQGPYRAAPTTMGTRTREMEKVPKRMKEPRSWSTTTMAVSKASPVSFLVSKVLRFIFNSSLLSPRSRRVRRRFRFHYMHGHGKSKGGSVLRPAGPGAPAFLPGAGGGDRSACRGFSPLTKQVYCCRLAVSFIVIDQGGTADGLSPSLRKRLPLSVSHLGP